MEGSNIVVTTSTNGTSAIAPFHKLGSMLTTAPINNPPALPPEQNNILDFVYPLDIKNFPASIKSKNVFFLLNNFPSSYDCLP